MKLHTFTALPTTPPKLQPLLEIASNMWFSWNWDARQLFLKIDPDIWEAAHKNPLRVLCDVSQARLEELANNEDYVTEVRAVYTSFKKYMSGKTWFDEHYGHREKPIIAYFSAEFGIHESLPIYSGGLGVLAGDHLKSASDLGVPLVALGFLYREGYFRQGLNAEGMQQEFYPENDKFSLPVELQKDAQGNPLLLSMDIGGDEVFYQIWKVQVGRVPLYLLDTNLHCNIPKHRDITKRLYDADRDMRLRQEILLGMGGVVALHTLGINANVYHINEGHSAFLILERLRYYMETKLLSYDDAKELVCATNVFTTHTPVPAGNERFSEEALKHYLGNFVQKRIGLSWDQFLTLGREEASNLKEDFCLTVLALKFASYANGVAKLHGSVSRDMWKKLYPGVPGDEIPIGHITNGVHTKTWLSKNFEQLFIRYMDTAYVREIADFNLWKVVDQVPNAELWFAHLERKKGMIQYIRERLEFQYKRRGASLSEISKIKDVLDPSVLTIGFARRFAPYKRGNLIFEDIERAIKLFNHSERPIQIIIAGKAHPADTMGKDIIKSIFNVAKMPELYKRVVLLEDYDIDMARYLVQGVDVWLNNPRRPLEASGTSGMKAAMNGALNVSILDGWWDEAFDGENGWAIGHAETYDDLTYQDAVESNMLYRLLESEVAPLYYERDEFNIPAGWVKMMKNTIRTCGAGFNAHRMVSDYINQYYMHSEKLYNELAVNDAANAKKLAEWRKNIHKNWQSLKVIEVESLTKDVVYSGSSVAVKARVKLGEIPADSIRVEVYYGSLTQDDKIKEPKKIVMQKEEQLADITIFTAMIPCANGGRYGYTVRVLPSHKHLAMGTIPELMKWSE